MEYAIKGEEAGEKSADPQDARGDDREEFAVWADPKGDKQREDEEKREGEAKATT